MIWKWLEALGGAIVAALGLGWWSKRQREAEQVSKIDAHLRETDQKIDVAKDAAIAADLVESGQLASGDHLSDLLAEAGSIRAREAGRPAPGDDGSPGAVDASAPGGPEPKDKP